MDKLRTLPTNAKRGVLIAFVLVAGAGIIAALTSGGDNPAKPAANKPVVSDGGESGDVDRDDPRSVMVALGKASYRCEFGAIYDLITGKKGAELPASKEAFVKAGEEGDCKPRKAPKIEALLNGPRYGDFQSVIVRVTGDPDAPPEEKALLVRESDGWRVDYPTTTGDEFPQAPAKAAP